MVSRTIVNPSIRQTTLETDNNRPERVLKRLLQFTTDYPRVLSVCLGDLLKQKDDVSSD